ncbi:MAG: type II toxin-antitoxin system RelE/ParE family toxin [Alphaproteobacteria bacterium]|nr:type II toxin-antitoxin system RelE/ParE family toxin [Alphaproteobacteria bacterium]
MRVRWKTTALRDIEHHVAYLDQVNPRAAHETALALFSAGESLSTFPNRGRHGRIPGTRELLAISPYVIVYEVGADAVEILNVQHGKLLT